MMLYHMSGAGNDFAVLDVRKQKLDLSAEAVRLCERLGADGLLAVDTSEEADFRLHFYNCDGLRGEMCGNGARCVCKFAYDTGIAGAAMTVQTDAGIVRGWRIEEDIYRVQLNEPGVVDLHRLENAAYVELGDPGVPHCVTHIPGLSFGDREKLLPLALSLRHDPAFPKGVNVNFYDRLEENRLRIMTYERGVEDYTLACGTGSASVAVVLRALGQLPGGKVTLENPGGDLTVTLQEGIYLEGPAKTLHIMETD